MKFKLKKNTNKVALVFGNFNKSKKKINNYYSYFKYLPLAAILPC